MRAPIRIASAALVLAAAACTQSAKQDAAKDDFKRDLALASATNLDVAAPAVNPALLSLTLENAPAAPTPATVIKKAESGPKVVQSEAPTVQAAVEPEPAAVVEATPVAMATAPAPAPEAATPTAATATESNEPVAVAPRPQPGAGGGSGDYGRGTGDYGRGGGVYGGGVGVVIRGGGVGDGDHCEIRPRGGIIFRSPVYSPRPMSGTSNPGRIATPRGITIVRR